MLLQELLKLNESADLMDKYVEITDGEHTGVRGYVNKLFYGEDGKVDSVEVQSEDDDEFIEVKVSEVKLIEDDF